LPVSLVPETCKVMRFGQHAIKGATSSFMPVLFKDNVASLLWGTESDRGSSPDSSKERRDVIADMLRIYAKIINLRQEPECTTGAHSASPAYACHKIQEGTVRLRGSTEFGVSN
jgi:hypothetical protein